jgi:hypothetical protein
MTKQQQAAKKLTAAERELSSKMKALKRLVTSIGFWQRRVSYYTRRSSMTDAELHALVEKRRNAKPKPTRVPRGIKL